MNRRSVVAVLLLLSLCAPHLAWAQGNGNGNGQGQGSENGQGNGNSNAGGNGNSSPGNSNAGGNGNGNGNSNGNGNNGGSQGNGNAGQNSASDAGVDAGAGTPAPSSGTSGTVAGALPASAEQSESDILAAVESGRAVPLATILPDVRSRTGGEVINAQLQQVQGFLLYAVTVLTPVGKVITEYYYARSGQHVAQ